MTDCAASITAGSSTSTAIASTCRTCRKHQAFTEKVRAKAYPAVERHGLIWTYMGARAQPPALPSFEAVLVPDGERNLFMVQRECNWLQALEGDIDTSHLGFLHPGSVEAEDADPSNQGVYALTNRAPEYHVADTDWGTMYAAYRPAEPRRHLLALRALHVPILDNSAGRPFPRARHRPRLGADGRPSHHVRARGVEEER